MTTGNVEIERIVREVVRRLSETPAHDPADDGVTVPAMTGPATTVPATTVPAMTVPAMTGPSMTGPSSPVRPRADRSELEIRQRVISLAVLKGRLGGCRCVRVPRGAIVTPSARDELRKLSIRIETLRGSDASETTTTETEVFVATWQTTFCPRAFLDAMRGAGQPVTTLDLSDGPQRLVQTLTVAAPQTNRRGVLLTDKPSLAICLSNRPPNVRTAWGLDARSVAEAASSLAANLLVVEPARHSLPAIVSMTRSFLGCGGGSCPEIVKRHAAVGG